MKFFRRVVSAVIICAMMFAMAGCSGSSKRETAFSPLAVDWVFDYAENGSTITQYSPAGPNPTFECSLDGDVEFQLTDQMRTGKAELQPDGSYIVGFTNSAALICTVNGYVLQCQVAGKPYINIYFRTDKPYTPTESTAGSEAK